MGCFSKISAYILLAALLTGCGSSEDNGKLKVAAGLPPVAGLAKLIGGDRIEVISVLPEGKTPHDFAPTPNTVAQAAKAKVFFTTGMQFENKVAERMQKNGKICDVSSGIERIDFHDGSEHHDHHHHDDNCSADSHDPHVWLSLENAIIIADNIRAELTEIDPDGKEYYQKNFDDLKERLLALDRKISENLAPYKGKTFFVYHPAFGYFADAYGLKQRAISLNDREIKAENLSAISKEAREAGVSTIFVQEQFNPRSAEMLAGKINGNVVPLDPLVEDLPANLEKIADALNNGFSKTDR